KIVELGPARVGRGLLRLARGEAVEIEEGALGRGEGDLGHPVERELHVVADAYLHGSLSARDRRVTGCITSRASPASSACCDICMMQAGLTAATMRAPVSGLRS